MFSKKFSIFGNRYLLLQKTYKDGCFMSSRVVTTKLSSLQKGRKRRIGLLSLVLHPQLRSFERPKIFVEGLHIDGRYLHRN